MSRNDNLVKLMEFAAAEFEAFVHRNYARVKGDTLPENALGVYVDGLKFAFVINQNNSAKAQEYLENTLTNQEAKANDFKNVFKSRAEADKEHYNPLTYLVRRTDWQTKTSIISKANELGLKIPSITSSEHALAA